MLASWLAGKFSERHVLQRLLSFARAIKHRWMRHRARLDRNAASPAARDFWRNHGRDWALSDASDSDLDVVGGLASRIAALPQKHKEAEAASAFHKIWRSGFSNPTEALSWDAMNDGLSPAALVAFVEGAGMALKEKRPAS
jgi:hypothetical protein